MLLLVAYALSSLIIALSAIGRYRLAWLPAAAIWLTLCAFRQSGGGSDLQLYTEVFRSLNDSDTLANAMQLSFGWEPGYVALMLLAKRIGIENPTILFAGIAVFNFAVITRFLVRFGDSPAFSFLFYLSTYLVWQQFVLVRQSIAISLILIATTQIIAGKRFRALIFVLLASTFHYSAILCLLFFIVFRLCRHLSIRRLCLVSLIASATIAFSASIVPLGLVFGYLNQVRDYSSYMEGGARNFLPFIEACVLLVVLYRIAEERNPGDISTARTGFFTAQVQARILALMLPVFAVAANFEVINRFLEYERTIYVLAAGTLLHAARGRQRAILWALILLYCAARFTRFYLTFDQGALQDYTIGIGP